MILDGLRRELRKIQEQELEAVGKARAAGCSWEQIGVALGLTRQGARQRYSKYLEEKILIEVTVMGFKEEEDANG